MNKRVTRVLEAETPTGTVLLALRLGGGKEPTVLAAGKTDEDELEIEWMRDQESVGAIMSTIPKLGRGTTWIISLEDAPEIGPGSPWKLGPLMKRLGIHPSMLDAAPEPTLDEQASVVADDSGAPIDLPEDSIIDLAAIDVEGDEEESGAAESGAPDTSPAGLSPRPGIYEWRGKRPGGTIGMIACFVIADSEGRILSAAQSAVGRNLGESDGPPSGLDWKTKRSEMARALRPAPPFDAGEPELGGWSKTRKEVPNVQSSGSGFTPEDLWREDD